MTIRYRRELQPAVQVFDLEDQYARERGVQGMHPRPFGRIQFSVIGHVVGGNRQLFASPQLLVILRNPSGYHLFFGMVRLPGGELRRAFQSAGVYTVRIESRYYQPLEADIELPMPDRRVPAFFDLAPGYLYPFPRSRLPGGGGPTLLRGRVVDGAHQGIERITIQVVGQETIAYFTDSSGQWILVFPDTQPSGLVSLRFLRPDTTSEIVNAISIEQGTESSLDPVVLVP